MKTLSRRTYDQKVRNGTFRPCTELENELVQVLDPLTGVREWLVVIELGRE
jgi:hypothetical protein